MVQNIGLIIKNFQAYLLLEALKKFVGNLGYNWIPLSDDGTEICVTEYLTVKKADIQKYTKKSVTLSTKEPE